MINIYQVRIHSKEGDMWCFQVFKFSHTSAVWFTTFRLTFLMHGCLGTVPNARNEGKQARS